MLSVATLKGLLHKAEFTRTDKLLFCLAVEANTAKQVGRIKGIAASAGLRAAQKWNISDILSSSRGRAIRTPDGWELSPDGRSYVRSIAAIPAPSPVTPFVAQLKTRLTTIQDKQVAAFIEESIDCLEAELYRASVVLSWVGAVSILENYVVKNKIGEFNAEATRRDTKWKAAKTADDLGRMKEHDFLEVICAISVIGNNVKQELDACLKFRNGCGHPNSLRIGEAKVAAHVETLIQNVFQVFPS